MEPRRVEIVFPQPPSEPIIRAAGAQAVGEELRHALSDVISWFEGFGVESIELSVEASIETGTLIKLILSAGGKGAMKVTLKPKSDLKRSVDETPIRTARLD